MSGQGTLHDPHYWRGVQKCANKGGAFCSWGAGLALSLEPSTLTDNPRLLSVGEVS